VVFVVIIIVVVRYNVANLVLGLCH